MQANCHGNMSKYPRGKGRWWKHFFGQAPYPWKYLLDTLKANIYVSYCSLDAAESTSFSVEHGDLIVLATDGLFDNVSTEQILEQLSQLEVCLVWCSKISVQEMKLRMENNFMLWVYHFFHKGNLVLSTELVI